jgi:hypothetical protein
MAASYAIAFARVSFKADEMPVREKTRKLLVMLTFEGAIERVEGRQVGVDGWRTATC